MAEIKTHETEIAKIDTRFYSFQGAWGSHQAILVDTETGTEYEILNKDHLKAPYFPRAVSAEQIQMFATRLSGPHPMLAHGEKPHYFTRHCFGKGLGYTPVHI
jgi:hypothetical protein